MNRYLQQFANKLNSPNVKIIWLVLTISLLLLAAGAPASFGDFSGHPSFIP